MLGLLRAPFMDMNELNKTHWIISRKKQINHLTCMLSRMDSHPSLHVPGLNGLVVGENALAVERVLSRGGSSVELLLVHSSVNE